MSTLQSFEKDSSMQSFGIRNERVFASNLHRPMLSVELTSISKASISRSEGPFSRRLAICS